MVDLVLLELTTGPSSCTQSCSYKKTKFLIYIMISLIQISLFPSSSFDQPSIQTHKSQTAGHLGTVEAPFASSFATSPVEARKLCYGVLVVFEGFAEGEHWRACTNTRSCSSEKHTSDKQEQ